MTEVVKILNLQREFFNSSQSKDINYRKAQLHNLLKTIYKYEEDILLALKKDLSKSSFESYETEVGLVINELKFMIKNLRKFSKDAYVKTPIAHFPSRSKIYREPYGIVLIISPWNYPFQLTMMPLIGAIASGNCVVIKPSEYSINTSKIIEKIIKEIFSSKYVHLFNGGKEISEELLSNKFDYIFFTGSVSVGKIVMKKAAENLTPVTLELGGKSPCIVDNTVNVNLVAKRIVWGKLLNAGQTCVAPDYILVHKSIKIELIEGIKRNIEEFYGKRPEENEEYPKIINKKHFDRLKELIDKENNVYGGKCNKDTLKISPAIIANATWESESMKEEIFGPIIPIIEYENLETIAQEINKREKPLALYLFTTSIKNENYIMKNISFGGGCINDTVIHLANHHLPFGGVGESGIGCYHGKRSFDTFSHSKGVLKKSNILDIPLRYPPFKNLSLLKKIY